jgi:sucrose-phosphate synthase
MGLVVLHLHLHGLFRGHDLPLGHDGDTGGQTAYVLDLVRSLAAHPELERVEVVTRLIRDPRVSADYGRPLEVLGPRLQIRRLPFGPAHYLPKEALWPHLDQLVESLCADLLAAPRLPDWIHAHYADAGYVGAMLRRRLGVPLVFTAHSLGREKRRRLTSSGLDPRLLEQRYALERRIAAEELALAHSSLVVTGTRQELEIQYASYASFRPHRARVIAPGVDGQLFHPPRPGVAEPVLEALLASLLRQPERPPLLAICRPDARKNIPALLEAFASSPTLSRRHNLVLVLGSGGTGPAEAQAGPAEPPASSLCQQVLTRVRHHQLEGRVACPQQLRRDQIPALYRWAACRQGVFVNPALTEPFGLTLLEAAASGLPLVATSDGGPREILERCANGLLVDVAVPGALRRALEEAFTQPLRWRRWSAQGVAAVRRHYSWQAHRRSYLAAVASLLAPPASASAAAACPGLGGRLAVAAGVMGVGGGHPVAEVVGPVLPARQPLGAEFGVGHAGQQLGDLHR